MDIIKLLFIKTEKFKFQKTLNSKFLLIQIANLYQNNLNDIKNAKEDCFPFTDSYLG